MHLHLQNSLREETQPLFFRNNVKTHCKYKINANIRYRVNMKTLYHLHDKLLHWKFYAKISNKNTSKKNASIEIIPGKMRKLCRRQRR